MSRFSPGGQAVYLHPDIFVPETQPLEVLEAVLQEGVKVPWFTGRRVAGEGPEKQQFLAQGVGQALGGVLQNGDALLEGVEVLVEFAIGEALLQGAGLKVLLQADHFSLDAIGEPLDAQGQILVVVP